MSIKLNHGFILRKIGPQYMAVPFGTMSTHVGGMITLSESGYRLWQAIECGVDSEDGLTDILTDTYDVDRTEAARDVSAFIADLRTWGALAV